MMDRYFVPIRQICLAPAELILVPCQNARELVNRNTVDERVNVLYPPVEGENSAAVKRIRQLHGHGPQPFRRLYLPHPQENSVRSHYIFLAVGIYEPRSNFHVLLDPFEVVLGSLEPVQQQRVSLIVAGSWSTERQRAYRGELRTQLASYSAAAQWAEGNKSAKKILKSTKYISNPLCAVATLITLHSNLSFEARCTLYRISSAVLNANVYDLYVPSLIEAFYCGRLVITARSDFVVRVVRDSVTGLVVNELDAAGFARIILTMLQPQGPSYNSIAIAAAHEYDDVYSFESFTDRLHLCMLAMLSNAEDNQFTDEL